MNAADARPSGSTLASGGEIVTAGAISMKAATRHGDRSLVGSADSDASTYLRPAGQVLLRQLLDMEFIAAGSWEALTSAGRRELEALTEVPALMARLVAAGLLTDYQAGRLSAAHLGELLVGEYRVLDFLGSGGMSMIFKAEHRQLPVWPPSS